MKFTNLKVSFIVILLTGASLLIYNQYQIQISVAEKIEKVLEGDLLNDTGIATNKAKQTLLYSKGVMKTKPISKTELEKLITEGIGSLPDAKSFEPKTPKAKRTELDKLDESYASTRPAKVLLNSTGQPKAIYTSYTQAIESHSQFIDEAKSLLDLKYKGASLNPIKETCVNQRCVSRYERMAFDVPVLFSDMALTTVDKVVTSITGTLNQPNISEEMVKNGDLLSEQELLTVAQGELPGQWSVTSSTYGIYESTGGATSAYHVKLESGIRVYEMVIDARTKTVLNKNDNLKHNTNASGLDLSGDKRKFSVIPYLDKNYLRDTRFPNGANTTVYEASLANVEPIVSNDGRLLDYSNINNLPVSAIVSSDNLDSDWNPSAVSVIGHFEQLFNYFSDTHNYRFGESGSYAQPINLIVDIDYPNAFNLGTTMGFGRGENLNYAASFEVVGHELGHGIVGDLAGLRGSGWPSSLNESFSDLFGVLASPNSGWGVGDDSPNTGVRSMSNPSSRGDAMFYPQYRLEQSIYSNAGISNYFFYLIAEGLTLDNLGTSIGRDALSQLAFATLSSLSSRADFNDVYNGLIAESERTYGEDSDETQAIDRAAEVIGYKQILDNSQTTVITQNSVFKADGINITAFLSPNFNTNYYDLYLQSFASNNPVYNEDNVLKVDGYLLNTAPAMATFNKGEGDYFVLFYKGFNNAIYYLEIDADGNVKNEEFLSSDIGESISNLQVSSDFNYFAFTFNDDSVDNQNTIALFNIDSESFEYLTPQSRSYTEGVDGVPFDNIDAIDFDPTNRRLVFDYLNCSGRDETNFENVCAWQIGIYDLVNSSYEYPFASLDKNINVGNPSFANIDSNNIVFDLFVELTNRNEVWIFNTSNKEVRSITSSSTSSVTSPNYTSRPFFTQDDSGIVFSVKQSDLDYDGYLFNEPISNYSPIENQEGSYINVTNPAIRPITTSLESIDARPSLTLSKTSLDFGNVITKTQSTICLTNNTTYPIQIYKVTNELSTLNLSAIPNLINAGKKHCIPLLIDVDNMEIGDFSQEVRLIHDGMNSPSIINVIGVKVLDTDEDGIPNIDDNDDDNDGVLDKADAYPLISIGDLTDTDGDGAPDTCDEVCIALGMGADTDDDNDGVLDKADAYPLAAIGDLTDTDADGAPDTCDEACVALGMAADTDDDNDGVSDTADAYPLISIGDLTDTDLDGAPDTCDEACVALGMTADSDDDNDGIKDIATYITFYTTNNLSPELLELPNFVETLTNPDLIRGKLELNPTIIPDYRLTSYSNPVTTYEIIAGSYVIDASTQQFDNEIRIVGEPGERALHLYIWPKSSKEIDGKQVTTIVFTINLPEDFDYEPGQTLLNVGDLFVQTNEKFNANGLSIWWEDSGRTGNLDLTYNSFQIADAYPLIPIGELVDTDSDGAPDTCDEACVALGMAADTDDDNDGIADTVDLYPLISILDIGDFVDNDADGAPDTCDEACVALGMAADTDDDNDGVLDTTDAYSLVSIGDLTDTDSDGAPDTCDEVCIALGMGADTDDDNDGVLDKADAYPLAAIGDLTDTDADGAPDTCDEACVELGMAADTDDDNDGVLDTADVFPLDADKSTLLDDDSAPVVIAPADIYTTATGKLTPVELGQASVSDNLETLTAVANETGPFVSGQTDVEWSATDSAGNTGSNTQSVFITPLVIPSDATVIRGETSIVDIALSGEAVDYPVLIPISLNVEGINLSTNQLEILSGTETSFAITVDAEVTQKTVTVLLSEPANAALSDINEIIITINSGVIAPYTLLEQPKQLFASLTPTAKIIVTSSEGENFFDVAKYVSSSTSDNLVTVVGETFLISGSSNIDGFMVQPGVKYDLTNLKGGIDKLYFSGPLAEYADSILLDSATGVMQLSRLTDVGEEIVQFIATASAADTLIFTDGALSTADVKAAVSAQTPLTDLTLDTSIKALDDKTITGATVKHIVLSSEGGSVMGLGPSIKTLISGNSGIDQIYVPAGSIVDASNLKSGRDEITVEGNLADYDITLDASGNIVLNRKVDIDDVIHTESVTVANGGNVATNDLVIFADQQLDTSSIKQQL